MQLIDKYTDSHTIRLGFRTIDLIEKGKPLKLLCFYCINSFSS